MKQRARYGIDAPGVRPRAYCFRIPAGGGGDRPRMAKAESRSPALSIGAASVAALLLFYAAVMLRSSLVGKKRVRDRLVAALALSGQRARA